MNNEAPRRCYVEKMVPAELKIREAIILAEDMGADPRLTDAVVLLGQAKDRIADFVDGIEGHTSRDPEVAKWIEDRDNWIKRFEALQKELSAEREKMKSYTKEKFSCPCGETTYLLEQHPNHFVGCISHNPTKVEKLKAELAAKNLKIRAMENEAATCTRHDWHQELQAEREASRKLVEAAKLFSDHHEKENVADPDDDYHMVCQLDCAACLLQEALKSYATPGHSPEGVKP